MTATVTALLRQRTADQPDRTFLRFASSERTYAEVDQASDITAAKLAALGVRPGDAVGLMLGNSPDFIQAWFGANKIGAICATVNTSFRGPALVHMLNIQGAQVLVIVPEAAAAIEAVADQLAHLKLIVVCGDVSAASLAGNIPVVAFDAVDAGGGAVADHPVTGSDIALLLGTSGTTGRSKACALSHTYTVRQAELMVEHLRLTPDDVLYCPFPLFHLDAAVLTVMPALVSGGVAAIGERFSVSRFWDEVRAFEATVFDFMGATLTMLHNAPLLDDDADNPVRLAWGVPVPDFAREFESRFGLRLVELYGSTDAGVPVYEPLDQPRRPGSCGKPIGAYDVRLFDAHDCEIETGATGEIVVRPNEPDLIASGYFGMPEETLAARRNLWFHTGDLARADQDGYLYFVGRLKDAIRRRGENISAFEVEEIVKAHPNVLDVAAYGVPSELTEDDVMVAVVPHPSCTFVYEDLIAFCTDRMAAYMVPRYVELVDDLPRTPTEKVEKQILVARGVTATTWDRTATRAGPSA
ncbi:AMP-binding protein [Streptomyces phytophilus]|uniref:AMP-binding protein n=1 Tax=Streptomyces phytophilus TaxID=722715 RepID=UPI0015F0167F|nr:AMP-binding protein [Streptomyces phytophilus]